MNTLTKESENLILDAIQDVCGHVSDGEHPTDAVIKVASDRDLPPNFVRLVCQGYNTGATNYQREKSASVLDKLADFPLASANKAIASLYPESPKTDSEKKSETVISSEYAAPPKPVLKAASYVDIPRNPVEPYKRDSQMDMKKAFNAALNEKRSHEEKRHAYAVSQDGLLVDLGALGDYFKKSAYDRSWSFSDVDAVARQVYGDSGREVMNYVHTRNESKEARATDTASVSKPIDWNKAPFTLLDSCVKAAQEVTKLRDVYQRSIEATSTKVAELTFPFVVAPKQPNLSVLGNELSEKSSGIMQSIVGSSIAKGMSKSTTPPVADLQENVVNKLTDPDHLNELRSIRAKAQLYDYLRNDEVISG